MQVSTIITSFVSGLVSFFSGLGSAIADLFKELFTETVGTGSDAVTTISTFGTWAIVLLVIGLGTTVLYSVISLIRH